MQRHLPCRAEAGPRQSLTYDVNLRKTAAMRIPLAFALLLAGAGSLAAQTAHSGAAAVKASVGGQERRQPAAQQEYWLSRDLNAMVGRFKGVKLR